MRLVFVTWQNYSHTWNKDMLISRYGKMHFSSVLSRTIFYEPLFEARKGTSETLSSLNCRLVEKTVDMQYSRAFQKILQLLTISLFLGKVFCAYIWPTKYH